MFRFNDFDGAPHRRATLKAIAVVACCLSWPAFGAGRSGPFAPFAGEWRGTGRVETSDGKTETISCRARYDISEEGEKLTQSLVCASDSYRFDIQSDASAEGDRVTGNWQETTRNVGGPLRGQVGSGDFEGAVDGPGFTATISLRSNGRRQAVEIRPQSQAITAVTITMKRTG
jgi:hypothetical protein